MRVALIVLTTFAVAWAWAGLHLSGSAEGLVWVAVAISLLLLALGWRGSGLFPSRGAHVGRVVGLWSGIEFAALFLTANIVENLHRGDLMLPLGAVIVGLHFFPLARGIPVRFYHATGAGLVAVGLAGLLLPPHVRELFVGFGAATVLWATAFVFVLDAKKAERPPAIA